MLPCNHFVSASRHASLDLPLANLSDVVYDANCYRYMADRWMVVSHICMGFVCVVKRACCNRVEWAVLVHMLLGCWRSLWPRQEIKGTRRGRCCNWTLAHALVKESMEWDAWRRRGRRSVKGWQEEGGEEEEEGCVAIEERGIKRMHKRNESKGVQKGQK